MPNFADFNMGVYVAGLGGQKPAFPFTFEPHDDTTVRIELGPAMDFLTRKDYVDNVLATLPDTYKALERLGLYGDFFSFYLCDVVLKVNGKGGEPVYIKLAGQDTGRCTPR